MSLLELRGPVDPHVHLRDLEWAHKATFASETAAALAGGYWAVLDMPNTPPATTSAERLRDKKTRLAAEAHCDFGTWLGASGAAGSDDLAAAERHSGQIPAVMSMALVRQIGLLLPRSTPCV